MRVSATLAVLLPLIASGCLGPHATYSKAPPPSTRGTEIATAARPIVRAPLPPLSIERPAPHVDGWTTDPRDAALLVGLKSAVVQTGMRSVGSTSVVFKVPLDGGVQAAFKPETRKHGGRWRGEVAAYRLSRALGLDHVPVAVPRATKMTALSASTRSAVAVRLLRDQCLPDVDGRLSGAMVAWVPGLARLRLEDDPLWSAWREWLSVDPPARALELRLPPGAARDVRQARALSPQVSTLVAFDHLIGNRDRWSGHNVLVDVTRTRLVFLDHNLAFDAQLDVKSTAKRTMVLHRVQRFSRGLVTRLRALSRAELVDVFGLDDRGAPLLSDEQIDATLGRRDELIAWIDSLVAKHGEGKVLAFE
ncbi:MAG: hypothetical protein HYV09_35090 [Deltaproteobacteria bacterium]|nr:hypothetical protein [Deltaproteobacteria bacterium]